jgi:hypothetical protein
MALALDSAALAIGLDSVSWTPCLLILADLWQLSCWHSCSRPATSCGSAGTCTRQSQCHHCSMAAACWTVPRDYSSTLLFNFSNFIIDRIALNLASRLVSCRSVAKKGEQYRPLSVTIALFPVHL